MSKFEDTSTLINDRVKKQNSSRLAVNLYDQIHEIHRINNNNDIFV